MMQKTIRVLLVGLLACLLATAAWAREAAIIASLQRVQGQVSVQTLAKNQTLQGRNGLLLHAGDTVMTGAQARATIKFRDGSEIRLFPKTHFVVKAKERKGTGRFFNINLIMRFGSFWGHFVKQRQVANINTPTATIGIKGTTLRVVERDHRERVALTEGLIGVNNATSQVDLHPGQRLPGFSRTDTLPDKVEPIPNKLDLRSDQSELAFPNGHPVDVYITVQLVNIKTGQAVRRAGPLYLRSNYDKIEYPSSARLDQQGFARVTIRVKPPEPADASLNGNVYVWAVLDQESADDTSAGRILFHIPVPPGQEHIRVESRNGQSQRMQ